MQRQHSHQHPNHPSSYQLDRDAINPLSPMTPSTSGLHVPVAILWLQRRHNFPSSLSSLIYIRFFGHYWVGTSFVSYHHRATAYYGYLSSPTQYTSPKPCQGFASSNTRCAYISGSELLPSLCILPLGFRFNVADCWALRVKTAARDHAPTQTGASQSETLAPSLAIACDVQY
jgi:hypothetical protein